MKAPFWWDERGLLSTALLPFSAFYMHVSARRWKAAKPVKAKIPVICVGNLVAGGAGKTPSSLAIASLLLQEGRKPHFLTRGYGGSLKGPTLVDLEKHSYRDVGDEALLLARKLPTWVSRDRPQGAAAAAAKGADFIIMDDGLQNPSLIQDLALLVIDGVYGLGNGRVLPAGPLRGTWEDIEPRIDCIIIIGNDRKGAAEIFATKPQVTACLCPKISVDFRGARLMPFAGIGRPEKFFQTLRDLGAELSSPKAFPDHHAYTAGEIGDLRSRAIKASARLITTEKDFVRLPADTSGIEVLPVHLTFEKPSELEVLTEMLRHVRPRLANN